MYLLIFTYLDIQAVHIEIVPDMGTMSFVQALTHFMNTEGIPTNNAKSFSAT